MSLEQLRRRYLEAELAGDDAALAAIANELGDDELSQLLAELPELDEDTTGGIDVARLDAALARAGFAEPDRRAWCAIAAGDLPGYLDARMREHGLTVDELAASFVQALDALAAADQPAVRRYLTRILERRHDVRRVTDTALAALADVVGASTEALRRLADSTPGVAPAPAAAARGNGNRELHLRSGDDDAAAEREAVDQLFNGRS